VAFKNFGGQKIVQKFSSKDATFGAENPNSEESRGQN